MAVVNVAACEPDLELGRGRFRSDAFDLTSRLGAQWIGATVFATAAGNAHGPYHYHHGVEEWIYVVSGSPALRDPDGERVLAPGELVAFSSGPSGAHTILGPGRVVMFSVGARGWGESFVTVYPDSDKIGGAPGVMFRRSQALASWGPPGGVATAAAETAGPAVDLRSLEVTPAVADPARGDPPVSRLSLRSRLGARTWDATIHELAPGEAAAPYHFAWCLEEWLLVLAGSPTLRTTEGQTQLSPGDLACFPEGPDSAHQLRNDADGTARVVTFSAPVDRPRSVFYPDEGTVRIHLSDHEGFLFRLDDQIDYWDGEPGTDAPV
ncbi:MAG TPA: cupin domain-containing protein [Solirubrobacteraceae bacterium]|nr:cupin domain-containing protein [Solirubrobacteraceae bacterium]